MHDLTSTPGIPDRSAASAVATRADWESLADDLVTAAWRYASPAGSLIDLPGPVSASGRWSTAHEAFTRTFLAVAFRVRGAQGGDPAGLLERYAAGLAAGVDPAHAERWPTIAERRQSVPEAASLAIALSETKPWLWDRLDTAVQEQTIDYLAGVVGTSGYTNNWTWFQTVIESFLEAVGGPWSQDDLDRNDEIRESLYIGDGWYSDGAGPTGSRQNFDYYAGWAWHVYPLLDSRIGGRALGDSHRNRMRQYVTQARELVGSGGAPLFQGRSLTYRFAMLAPFWAAAIAEADALAVGETLALANRVLGHFREAGAIDERGLLPIGWHREFLPLRQLYTGAGSTYWASKAFLGLLLPEEHPEWTSPQSPRDEPDVSQHLLEVPGWIVVRTAGDGVVRAINHGTDGERHPTPGARADKPFYQRLGYSNVTSPDLSPLGIAAPRDSHIALVDAQGMGSHRGPVERVVLGERVAVSRSDVHWLDLPGSAHQPDSDTWAGERRGPRVTTASVVNGPVELRLAWYTPPEAAPQPSAAADAPTAWPEDAGPWRVRFDGWPLPLEGAIDVDPAGGAVVRADGIGSSVIAVQGIESVGTRLDRHPNPFAGASATPWAISGVVRAGEVAAAVVVLGSDAPRADDVPGLHTGDGEVVVTWPDGSVDRVDAPGVKPA